MAQLLDRALRPGNRFTSGQDRLGLVLMVTAAAGYPNL